MDHTSEQFRDLARLAAAGERPAVPGAANGFAESCLHLCAAPAASCVAAEDGGWFLAIMAGWAWPRRVAKAVVMDAAAIVVLLLMAFAPDGIEAGDLVGIWFVTRTAREIADALHQAWRDAVERLVPLRRRRGCHRP